MKQPEVAYEAKKTYPCPCCGYHTFPVPKEDAIAYICPVCFWENDVFTSSDDEPSDENHGMTLNEARRNYKKFGACSQDMLRHVREPRSNELS
ncbi:MAG: CPCC family cysteine-rich protein [Cellulosilyticaceae bacterium]